SAGMVLVGEATAAVPEALLAATARNAALALAGQLAEMSAGVLLKEVLRAMFWTRMRSGVGLLLCAVLMTVSMVTVGWLAVGQAAPPGRLLMNRPAPVDPDIPRFQVVSLGQKKFYFRAWVYGVAYSPDGKLLAVTEANSVHLFDAVTRKELRTWD